MHLSKRQNDKGSGIAELPGAIMLLLIGFAVPLIIYGTYFYRIYMFNCLVKNACQRGAAQLDLAKATTEVNNYLTNHGFVGITVSVPATVTVVTRTTTYNQVGVGNQNYDNYYLQVSANSQVAPLIPLPSFFGMSIPGMSGPLPLNMTTQSYFENQQALAPP